MGAEKGKVPRDGKRRRRNLEDHIQFLPAAKPRRSMDHKITVGGRGGRVLICLHGKFCEMRGRIGVRFSPWKILQIVFKFEVKSAMLAFMAHIHCPCCRRSIGPLPSCSFSPHHYEKKLALDCLIELGLWRIICQRAERKGRLFGYIIVERHNCCPTETVGVVNLPNRGKEEYQYFHGDGHSVWFSHLPPAWDSSSSYR